ncbi:hypothetical protein [Candidatus Enterococcus clewellii]|uniref:Aldose 1-epimerase n=1 Tax=Candidatus Enterococcus clewellii TaxID=1834193 RepID=A0A242K287_9ENTE|nr:hypothetical protein [Enterococcus sp. 9E7_DIV0242]OTP11685.1 hypothetical protein A5888_003784 [Enterococcus sp. 9E7_DIV0242]
MINILEENVSNDVNFIHFTIESELEITFSTIGASIFRIKFSDRYNFLENVTLTPDSMMKWLENRTYSGAIVAPLAGRYAVHDTLLEQNRPPLHFHGGTDGYDKRIWTYKLTIAEKEAQICFSLYDEQTKTHIHVRYLVNEQKQLSMEISAQTEQEIFFNPTNHLYFNLNGDRQKTIENHKLYLASDTYYVENSEKLIVSPVEIAPNSTLDFSLSNGKLLNELSEFGGLDTTFQFNDKKEGLLWQPDNGRAIHITTTLPAVVIFTFNQEQPLFAPAPKYAGITFETQYPANNLPLVALTKESPYYEKTVYSFLHL